MIEMHCDAVSLTELFSRYHDKTTRVFQLVMYSWLAISFLSLISILRYGQVFGSENSDQLIQLQVISRHGARTPFFASYPDDPNAAFLTFGKNQLTKKGSAQMYKMGERLGKRYEGFFKNDYRTVLARSSYSSRCVQSGQVLLSAIYPETLVRQTPGEFEVDELIQPVAIYSAPPQCDGMLDESRLQQIVGDYEIFFYKIFTKQVVQQLEKDVERITGIKNVTVNELFGLADLLQIEALHSKKLPPWFDTLYPRLNQFYNGFFTAVASNNSLAKQLAGKLLNEIVNNLEFSPKTKETNISIESFYYITHDVVFGSLLGLLGVPLSAQAPFGATILVEKTRSFEATFVKLVYLSTYDSEPQYLSLPGCKNLQCTLSEMKNILHNVNSD